MKKIITTSLCLTALAGLLIGGKITNKTSAASTQKLQMTTNYETTDAYKSELPIEEVLSYMWYDDREGYHTLFVLGTDTNNDFYIDTEEYGIPSNYYKYHSNIRLHAMYQWDGEQYVILEWHMEDVETGESLGHPDDYDLDMKYNIETYHDVETIEGLPDEIKLSEFKEGVIYRFIPTEEIDEYPKMINDLGEDCVLWTMHYGTEYTYGKYAFPVEYIQDTEFIFSTVCFYDGEDWRMMYQKADHDELLATAEYQMANLSELATLEPNSQSSCFNYIYNDLDRTVIAHITKKYEQDDNAVFDIEMKPGQLVGCIWLTHNIEIIEGSITLDG